jgi:hypothetical protein
MSNYLGDTPEPTPEQEAAAKAMLDALDAQANRIDRRLVRWCRRWLAYPCFFVLAGAQIVRRRMGRGE